MANNREGTAQNTEATSTQEQGRITAPAISLPKGGGAVRGIGEKFTANPVTGTGSMSVPIYTSPGRSGFGPHLALSYDSGAGNGIFGFGWNLALPSITRKTDKGLPQYNDSAESDVFILSGAEDLVPVLVQDGTGKWTTEDLPPRTVAGQSYRIRRYRPRIEGLFARIERWTNTGDATDVFWRSISKDNITTWYGRTSESRIVDPSEPGRIFSWMICQSHDDKGNVVVYGYKAEDSAKVFEDSSGNHLNKAHEYNRNATTRSAQRYLKRIRYGNRMPHFPELQPDAPWPEPPGANAADGSENWLFEVVLDYGEHAEHAPTPNESRTWPARQDPFSSYRATFEVRTYRLCQRVLMFHHFEGETGVEVNCLVRSTDFKYSYEENPKAATNPIFSFLFEVAQVGYQRDGNGGYLSRSLPPVRFEYSVPKIGKMHEVDRESLENLPYGLDGAHYQWVDLDGEGLSGILIEQGGALFYKRNLSPLNNVTNPSNPAQEIFKAGIAAKFGAIERVVRQPALVSSGDARYQLLDVAGNAQLDLVDLQSAVPGFYERTINEGWENFRPFSTIPVLNWSDPNLKFIDLTGDGHADILISQDEVFCWHGSLAEAGFGQSQDVRKTFDEEMGPAIVFADSTESIFLADFSGDGLTDIARIRNGEICYWPNLGYGRFGAKVIMDQSPWFEALDLFDGRRIRLADIDGSGLTDVIYLASSGVQIYYNQSGNSWSAKGELSEFPSVGVLDTVLALDLLGNGTVCLVWSSPLPGDAGRAMQYMDLMGGQKPHLLTRTFNNLGVETFIEYAPSTEFYLQDKMAGRPWVTRLPFPVHCVKRIRVYDKWRKATFTTTYSYHHGYFDGIEREFRGFGRVDQIDSEDYGTFSALNTGSSSVADDQTLYQPPVKTITWFHTGAFLDEESILSHYSDEYFPNWFEALKPDTTDVLGDFQENLLPESDFAELDLTSEEWRQALRACKGMTLRQEIYELDVEALRSGDETPVKLFSAAYHSCHLDRLQRQESNRHAVFLVTESEAITYHYELDLRTAPVKPDPRVTHTLNLRVDELGHVLQSVAVAYPRFNASPDSTLPAAARQLSSEVQKELHVAYTETVYTQDLSEHDYPDVNRLRLPCEVQTYELTGIRPEDLEDRTTTDRRDTLYFTIDELRKYWLSERYQTTGTPVSRLDYHKVPDGSRQKRIVEHIRTLYFDDASDTMPPTNSLPFGQHGPRGLKYEDYKLALTDDLLDKVFGSRLDESPTPARTARELLKNSSISGYLPGIQIDTALAGQLWMRSGIAGFESSGFFQPTKYTDPFDSVTEIKYDARALFVQSSIDDRRNKTEVVKFDYRVLAPREMVDFNGNRTEVVFDILGSVAAVAVKGKGSEADNLNGYDDLAFAKPDLTQVLDLLDLPPLTPEATRQRFSPLLGNATTRFLYHFGEKIENGNIIWADSPAGACAIQREIHTSYPGGATSPLQIALECSDGAGNLLMKKIQAEPESEGGVLRWIVNGLTVLNNKGKPVMQYEPDFREKFGCEPPRANGVTPVMYYDAPGRLIQTEFPDGTLSRVEFSPWYVRTFDQNDTVLESRWYRERLTASERDADPQSADRKEETKANTASADEKRAARLAANHANTPALTILDSLGREVIAVAHNRTPDANNVWQDDFYVTYTKLDAEGKPLWIRDARGNLVMQYITPAKADDDPGDDIPYRVDALTGERVYSIPCYDIAGNLLYQHSMDAGDRWMLMDAAGKPMLAWDLNDTGSGTPAQTRLYYTEYDALHRPTSQWLRIDNDPHQMVERFEYHDTGQPDGTPNPNLDHDRDANLIGQAIFHYDPSGRVELVARDFKGNVLDVKRQLNNQPAGPIINWASNPDNFLEAEIFVQHTEYDALNRMVRLDNWHRQENDGAIYHPTYNERGLLTKETITIRGIETTAIKAIHYNAKGQKERLELGNDTVTQYEYDPWTFRLTRLRTARPVPATDQCSSAFNRASVIQDLRYTYEPVGNITQIVDAAQATTFGNNQRIDPENLYEYDALYRLTLATGRENGALRGAPTNREDPPLSRNCPAPDPTAIRKYTETYRYDSVGNIQRMRHKAGPLDTWTRWYSYASDSNRLLRTWEGDGDWNNSRATNKTTYEHDTHGNMLNLASTAPPFHMRWDHRDMIASINLGGGGTAYYQYDADKQRTLKRITNQNGLGGYWERIYLGGYELYRRYNGGGTTLVEEIESHHLFEGEQRVLLVDDVITSSKNNSNYPRPDGLTVKAQTLFRYQYSNHLGSACLELDDHAEIISYEEYHPYGTSAYRAMKSGIEAPPKRYRYTGMERDKESGLSYHGARYYATWLARWINCDPVGLIGGTNLYSYASNPVQLVDRNGQANTIPPQAQNLLDEVKRVLGDHRLDSWTFESAVYEAQGGRVERVSSNDLAKHRGNLGQALTDARRVAKNLQSFLEDTRDLTGGKAQLKHAKQLLRERIALAEDTQSGIRFLEQNFPQRYAHLPPLVAKARSEGSFISERLNGLFAEGKITAAELRLVPEVAAGTGAPTFLEGLPARFRAIRPAVAEYVFTIPHPAALKQFATESIKAVSNAASDVSGFVTNTARQIATKLEKPLEAVSKAARVAGYAAAVYGAYNATEEANKGYDSVPSEAWLTEFGLMSVVGLVDFAGATGKTGWGDWDYMEVLMESYSARGMSPLQHDLARKLQK